MTADPELASVQLPPPTRSEAAVLPHVDCRGRSVPQGRLGGPCGDPQPDLRPLHRRDLPGEPSGQGDFGRPVFQGPPVAGRGPGFGRCGRSRPPRRTGRPRCIRFGHEAHGGDFGRFQGGRRGGRDSRVAVARYRPRARSVDPGAQLPGRDQYGPGSADERLVRPGHPAPWLLGVDLAERSFVCGAAGLRQRTRDRLFPVRQFRQQVRY